jgi:hypothetical protein
VYTGSDRARLVSLFTIGAVRSSQTGAGKAQSQCQQARYACFQGQPELIFRACWPSVAGEAGADVPDSVAERVRACFPQVLVVAVAQKAGPDGDIRGDAPATADCSFF